MDQTQKIKIAINTAYISGIFTLVVALLMLINFIQIKSVDPLEIKSMELLIERMREEPNNEELKKEIRDLDLMARKAFFTNQWQIKTGRYLMLFGAILFAFALRTYFSLISKIEEPSSQVVIEGKERILSQRWIAGTGGLLFLAAFISSFILKDYTGSYLPETYDTGIKTAVSSDQIEVVEVTEDTGELQVGEVSAMQDKGMADSAGITIQDTESEIQEVKEQSQSIIRTEVPGLTEIRQNYNSFRGPMGQGVSFSRDIPTEWDGLSGKNIRWKVKISKSGYNSPVIWKDYLFIAGADEQEKIIYCIDRHTGMILWQKKVENIPGSPTTLPRVTEDTGLSAPSLATDGIRVYAIFANGDIAAYSLDGRFIWGRNLGMPDNHYGHSSSLMVWAGMIFIQYDTRKEGKIMSLNCNTGETIWETIRNVNVSWASPILAEINGTVQVILSADPLVAGYDIKDGRELWAIECMMGEVGPSPAFSDGYVYAANEYARLVAIKPGLSPSIIWGNDEYLPEVSSPVAYKGLLFVATTYGVLVCYDALTGEKYWEKEFDRGFYSSPVIADGKLHIIDIGGKMHILKVAKTPEIISEPELGEPISSTPAFMDGRIYLRGIDNLYCIAY
jgi:outer membrane protein assembly factor BamB